MCYIHIFFYPLGITIMHLCPWNHQQNKFIVLVAVCGAKEAQQSSSQVK